MRCRLVEYSVNLRIHPAAYREIRCFWASAAVALEHRRLQQTAEGPRRERVIGSPALART